MSKDRPYYGWFRYREGYSGDLVKELVRRTNIDPNTEFVADPMSGSGSTLIACKEIGIDCLGLDVNPFAVETSNAKLQSYSNSDLKELNRFITNFISQTNISYNEEQYKPVNSYFSSNNFQDLLFLKSKIDQIDNKQLHLLLKTCWLSVLEECSNRKKDGNGLATRPTKVNNVFLEFKKKLQEMECDIISHRLPSNIVAEVIEQTALKFNLVSSKFSKRTNKKLKAIVFSPPYANSFDYFESYKIELIMGGYYTFNELLSNKSKLIRNYRITQPKDVTRSDLLVELLCQEIMTSIPKKEQETGKRDSRTRLVPNMLKGYFADMEQVLIEFSNALQAGGKVYIVVDQSAYVGVIIPTDIILARLALKHKFKVCSIIKCRKATTSGQQIKKYPYLKMILRESIVELEKIA